MSKLENQLPESFYVSEPSDVAQYSYSGGNGAAFKINRAVNSKAPWKINTLSPTPSGVLKKILICDPTFISPSIDDLTSSITIPSAFLNLFFDNNIQEIYYLEEKTGKIISIPIKKNKLLWCIPCQSNPQAGTASQIQSKLKKLENPNNWFILDQYEITLIGNNFFNYQQNHELLTINDCVLGGLKALVRLWLGYRLEKIKTIDIDYNFQNEDLEPLSAIFKNTVAAETVNLTNCSSDIVRLLPKNIKYLNLNGLQSADLSILNSFPQLEELTLSHCTDLKELPDLSKSRLKKIHIKCTRIRGKLSLPPGCIKKIEEIESFETKSPEIPETKSLQSNEVKKQTSVKDQKPHKKTIDTETYTDPETKVTCPIELIFVKDGRLIQGGVNELRMLRQEVCDYVEYADYQFSLTSENPEDFKDPELKIDQVSSFSTTDLEKMTDQQYYLSMPCQTNEDGWMPLPARYAYDQILSLAITDAKLEKIIYSTRSQCYWIKFKTPVDESAHLQLIAQQTSLPLHPQPNPTDLLEQAKRALIDFIEIEKNNINIPQDLKIVLSSLELLLKDSNHSAKKIFPEQLALFLRSFKNKSLDLSNDSFYPDILKIFKQQKGACRHRSFLFVILCRLLGFNARECGNPLHAFAEIVHPDGRVSTYDFDGANVKVELTPMHSQFPKTETRQKDPFPDNLFSPYLELPHVNKLDDLIPPMMSFPKLFVPVKGHDQARGIYQAIHTQAQTKNRPVFYAESYAQLIQGLSSFSINPGETPTQVPGPLATVLAEGGILVINCQRFSENELLKCASLLDEIPSFDKQTIHKKLSVINLITTDKVTACQAFSRRAPHLYWPHHIEKPVFTLPICQAADSISTEEKSTPVHLFNNSELWEQTLWGTPQLSPQGLSYQPGLLTSAKQPLTLIDPPVSDVDFQYAATMLSIEKGFWANGKFVPLSPQFSWSWHTAADIKPPSNLIPLADEKTNLADMIQQGADIIYLNSSNFDQLHHDICFNHTAGTCTETNGWLEQKSSKAKTIVLTGALTSAQYQELYYRVGQSPDQNIHYLDLTKATAPSTEPVTELKLETASGAYIYETDDPDFIANALLTTDMRYQRIDAQTGSELLESLTYECKPNTLEFSFKHQLSQITQDLLDGKTVILKGALSPAAYTAIQSLFNDQGHLKLYHEQQPVPIKGRLIVVTPPLAYPALVAQHTARRQRIPRDLLWKQYRRKAAENSRHYTLTNFTKIKKLADVVCRLTQGAQRVGIPPNPDFSFTQITEMLRILQVQSTRDNPIKSVFLRGYDKSSEIYAKINVVGKILFSSQNINCVQQEKLTQFPQDSQHTWRRLNCLNGPALRQLLAIDPTTFNPEKFLQLSHDEMLHKLQPSKLKLTPISKNPAHRDKVARQVIADLNQSHAVLLIGPPGSGKTTMAKQIAKARGEVFFGFQQLQAWREHKPTPGKKSTLIIDKANLSLHKSDLDQLLDLVSKLPRHHEIIFATGRSSRHPLWNKLPTERLGQWSDQSLKDILLIPLQQRILNNNIQDQHLNTVLKIFHRAADIIGINRIGNRHLEQLAKRWFFYQKKFPSVSPEKALLEAAKTEFLPLLPIDDKDQFVMFLFQTCYPDKPRPCFLFMADRRHFKNLVLRHVQNLFLSDSRIEILYRLYEQLHFKRAIPETKAGILLEGPSGKGKSRLACELLKLMEYKKFASPQQLLDCEDKDLSKTYIEITLTEQLIADPAWLLKAFDCGCTVVLNESNTQFSFPLLNDLLTGVTPDHKPPAFPGFTLIATQNPAVDGGRFELADDLLDRFQVISVPQDTEADLEEITQSALPCLSEKHVTLFAKKFMREQEQTPHLCTSASFFKVANQLRQTDFLEDYVKQYPG